MRKNVAVETTRKNMSDEDQKSLDRALICARAAVDKKAEIVRLLDLRGVSTLTDFVVICSGTSDRQVQAIGDSIAHQMREEDQGKPQATEGYGDARWLVVDYGDVVVHAFLDVIRDYYNLDGLWEDAQSIEIPSEFYGSHASTLN